MAVDISERPDYLDWIDDSGDWEDNWDYRSFEEYPPGDAPKKMIIEFMEDAKEAEQALMNDLIADGMPYSKAKEESCQWPLKDDAPIEIIRNFIGYQYELQEMAKRGEDA